MSFAAMLNKAGNVVQPTYANVQAAMTDFIDYVHQGLHTPPLSFRPLRE
jgi:hypothetical protein